MRFQNNIEQRLTGRHKKSFSFVGDIDDDIILDVGCSFGWFEKISLEGRCREIIGIDVDERNLLSAQSQLNNKRVQFLKHSVLDLSIFEKKYFDKIVMWDVLEHLPKNLEGKALREIERVLKPGGRLFLSTPNKNFWSCILDPAWYRGHRHYSLKQLNQIFKKNDFIIEKIEYGGKFHELFGMILLYFFKWVFKREIPFKKWFDQERDKEYLREKGFVTIFIKCKRN